VSVPRRDFATRLHLFKSTSREIGQLLQNGELRLEKPSLRNLDGVDEQLAHLDERWVG
jgi:hypothetical protein